MEEIARLSKELESLQIRNRAEEARLAERIREISTKEDNTTREREQPVDRHGQSIERGKRVKLLTAGRFRGSEGTVEKIGKSRATIRLSTNRSTTRIFRNIEVIEDNEHDGRS